VPFLPQDDTFLSTGVVKVPGAGPGQDLGLQGVFLPTGVIAENGPQSLFAGLGNPVLVVNAWEGDLGLDDGATQSIYRLDTTQMRQLQADGEPFRAALSVGDTVELPAGAGSVTFDDVSTWVNLQVSRNAGKELALAGALLAIGGLLPTLFVRRRRVWVRVRTDPTDATAGTVIELAGLDRAESSDDLAAEITSLRTALQKETR
jgi:cytochrome c biogenesis protein